jgi:hypothetical protein
MGSFLSGPAGGAGLVGGLRLVTGPAEDLVVVGVVAVGTAGAEAVEVVELEWVSGVELGAAAVFADGVAVEVAGCSVLEVVDTVGLVVGVVAAGVA